MEGHVRDESKPVFKKAKKKRSFTSMARKYGSRGLYGKGRNIDEETYSYYMRVMERLKEEFDSQEEKDVFIANVCKQSIGKEIDLSCNQLVSKIVEKFLPLSDAESLERFCVALQEDLRSIATDPYASHVLQKLLQIATQRVEEFDAKDKESKSTPEEPEMPPKKKRKKPKEEPEVGIVSADSTVVSESMQKHAEFCRDFLSKVSLYTMNNFEDFVSHVYASHIVRQVLQCLSGVHVDEDVLRSKRSRSHSAESKTEDGEKNVALRPNYRDKQFKELLKDFAQRIINWPQITDLLYSDQACGVFQTLLCVLHKASSKLCSKFLDVLQTTSFPVLEGQDETSDLPAVFSVPPALRTLEVALCVGTPTHFQGFYQAYFQNHLKALCLHPEGKFAVAKLITSVTSTEQFEAMLEELMPHFEELIASNSSNVILALVTASKRLSSHQGRIVQSLMSTFHCNEPADRQVAFAHAVAKLTAFEQLSRPVDPQSNAKTQFNYVGSQILQTLLWFNKTLKIVTSLLSTDSLELQVMFESMYGSHVLDAFISSPFVGEKNREKMVHKLKGSYLALATSRFGSRAFDTLWHAVSDKLRVQIAEELVQREAQLNGNMYGRIIAGKYNLALFKRQREEWKAAQSKERKTKAAFKELVTAPVVGQEKKAAV